MKEKIIYYPNLHAEMAKYGITQKELANMLGITEVSAYRKFNGKNDWTIKEVDKICEIFKKDYYELFK